MILVLIIVMLVSNHNIFSNMSNVVDVKDLISENIFIILCLVCSLSSTTHASISLEGKSLWIVKSIPVKIRTIFLSKVLVNLTLLIPFVLIGGTFFL